MSVYVPTTDDVRFDYATASKDDGRGGEERARAFNRWLARVQAEAAVTALRDASMEFYRDAEGEWDGYGVSHALTIDADRIAREAGISVNDEQEDDR